MTKLIVAFLNITNAPKSEGKYEYCSALNAGRKVKQSRYRPGVALRVLRKLRFPDFVTTAQDGGRW